MIVLVRYEGGPIRFDNQPERLGFFCSRVINLADAVDQERITHHLIEILNNELMTNKTVILESEFDLKIEDIKELPEHSSLFLNPPSGFTFYPWGS